MLYIHLQKYKIRIKKARYYTKHIKYTYGSFQLGYKVRMKVFLK